MTATPSGLGRIGQIALTVDNLERAIDFYRDRLGLRFLFRVPNLAFFDCDGTRLMLGRPEQAGQVQRGATLYFSVAEIQAAYRQLDARGVDFIDAPHVVAQLGANDLWMAFLSDPDGNLLAIMAEAPRAGAAPEAGTAPPA
jgi:methylmalonyl-CoA/ethylmalonyl-CoA epimerase